MKQTTEPVSGGRGTKIAECVCTHPYQDRKYGKQLRVHNPIKNGGWRCTVCKREHSK